MSLLNMLPLYFDHKPASYRQLKKIIIIIIFINSAALSKIRRSAGTCDSALSGVVPRWPWTMSTDAVCVVVYVDLRMQPPRQLLSWPQCLPAYKSIPWFSLLKFVPKNFSTYARLYTITCSLAQVKRKNGLNGNKLTTFLQSTDVCNQLKLHNLNKCIADNMKAAACQSLNCNNNQK